MNILEKIEKQYGFIYPELYKRLYTDGMLNWPVDYSEEIPAEYIENPPFLFFGYDFQFYGFDWVEEMLAGINDPDDYRAIPDTYKFIPIGETSGGDMYAFQFDMQDGENVPVTLLPHDDCEAVVQAKNLQDFMFRLLMLAASEINDYMPLVDCEGNRNNAFNTIRTHLQYLTKEQADILTDVYKRKVFTGEDMMGNEIRQLITDEECAGILKKMIGYKKLNYTFVYMGEDK